MILDLQTNYIDEDDDDENNDDSKFILDTSYNKSFSKMNTTTNDMASVGYRTEKFPWWAQIIVFAVVWLILTCGLESPVAGGCLSKQKNWFDWSVGWLLLCGNIIAFINNGNFWCGNQVSGNIILLTLGTVAQIVVWFYQLWKNPIRVDPEFLRTFLGVSVVFELCSLVITIIEIVKFG